MKLSGVQPLPHFLVLEMPDKQDNKTASGILLTENTNEYVLNSEVLIGTETYPVGTVVIYHVIDVDSAFRDATINKGYMLLHEDKVRGTYKPE